MYIIHKRCSVLCADMMMMTTKTTTIGGGGGETTVQEIKYATFD
jgi:hypothetical protein